MTFNLKEKIPNDVPYHFKFVIEDYEEYLNDSSIEITDDNKILIKLWRNDKPYDMVEWYDSLIDEIKDDYYGFLSKHHPEVTVDMIIVKEVC